MSVTAVPPTAAPLHVLVCSALFDRKAEGICTGRLVRGLLDAGARITLVTSSKSDLSFTHPRLRTRAFAVQPRDPKWLFRAWARLSDGLDCNLYVWSRRAARVRLDEPVDLVYARAWPDSSLMAGYRIAERNDLPLWIHLSDPMPPPADPPLSAGRRADLQRVADRALACTFTNRRTLEYQRRHLRFPREEWGQVLPHVAPEPASLGPRPRAYRYCYVGTFNRKRDPHVLLEPFRRVLERQPQARFTIAAPIDERLRGCVDALGLQQQVDLLGYRSDTRAVMAASDVLVGMDNLAEEPLYSLTKTIEYLTVDRPFVHVVQTQSPDCDLIGRFPETARAVEPGAPDAVAAALEWAAAIPDDGRLYDARFAAMRAYGAATLAAGLLQRMRQTLESAHGRANA